MKELVFTVEFMVVDLILGNILDKKQY